MSEKLVNLTGTKLNIIRNDETIFELFTTDKVAKCVKTEKEVKTFGDFTTKKTVTEVVDLPDPEEGTFYVVTEDVAKACPNREDLLVQGPPVYDSANIMVGYKGFITV